MLELLSALEYHNPNLRTPTLCITTAAIYQHLDSGNSSELV